MHEQTREELMIDSIADEAESATRDNDITDLYRLTKQIVQAKTNTVTAVRDKRGKLLMNEEEILERVKQHFEEVLNVDSARTGLPDGIGATRANNIVNLRGQDRRCHYTMYG